MRWNYSSIWVKRLTQNNNFVKWWKLRIILHLKPQDFVQKEPKEVCKIPRKIIIMQLYPTDLYIITKITNSKNISLVVLSSETFMKFIMFYVILILVIRIRSRLSMITKTIYFNPSEFSFYFEETQEVILVFKWKNFV